VGIIQTASIIPDDSLHEIEGRSSRTWKVRATDGRVFKGYFKWLPPNQLASEILCAYLGRAIGLNIPPFFIARPLASMTDPRKLPPVGFLSAEKRFHMFVQWGTDEARCGALPEWPGYRPAGAFDEWVANTDRRFHNLLFDPTDRDFWLIDHGHAFTGPDWCLSDLVPDGQWENLRLRFEQATKGARDISKWISATSELVTAAGRIDLDEVVTKCNSIPTVDQHVIAACHFLRERLFRVRPIIEKRLSGQQQFRYP